MRSAWLAATTLGMISLKTRIVKVTANDPINSAVLLSCPNRRNTMISAKVAAATLSSVLPNRIEPSSLSVCARSFVVSLALLLPLRTR